jgi:osmoprotectant transport system ATP-binding protein
VIEVEKVTLLYGERPALRDVSLRVSAGTTTALLGQSGCGKSTLMRLMVGLLRPTSGRVRVLDLDPAGPARAALQRRLGYVIQEGGLFPHLTARDNATIVVRHLRWPRARIDERLSELTELLRLTPAMLDRHPLALSGGQRQRVALLRALMLDPEVLLLDEPLGALDPLVRAELQDELRVIFQRLKKTVVIVTHDLAEAAHFADQIVLMNDGVVVAAGSLAALSSSGDAFVRTFLGAQRALSLEIAT